MTSDELIELVEKHCSQLVEHCDAVQIMLTWNENGLTRSLNRGSGNWYARQGMAHEFIQRDIAQEQATQIAEQLKDNEQ